jgi:hypothetical protein
VKKLQQFIDAWSEDGLGIKPVFLSLYHGLRKMDGVRFEFHDRPGISYSLRSIHEKQKDRPLFVMIDVIDDEPDQKWLSVCFYGDMITDPEALGDLIPGGLLGSDGYCFDVDESDAKIETYIGDRIREAYDSACGS